MEIISVNDIKKVKNPAEFFVEFILDANNLYKIPINVMYFKERGFRKFVLTYDYNSLKLPMTRVADKLAESILKIISTQDVVIALKGFPHCVFERNFLRPGLRWKYENKLLFLNFEGKDTMALPEKCSKCMMKNSCKGVSEVYLKNFSTEEFLPMISNKDLHKINKDYIEKFENVEVKSYALRILDDFAEDNSYLRKKIVYVKSFPDSQVESSKERIVYYIYNHYNDFEKTYEFILSFFKEEKELVEPFKVFLENADQFALSFAKMGDFGVRKSFYFAANDLSQVQIETLSEMTGVEIKEGVVGIGFDFRNETISYKVYYNYDSITAVKVKEFVSEVPFERKKLLSKFLNSLTKPVNQVFLDYKYKDFSMYSKRVDVSLQYNNFRLQPLTILLGLQLRFLDDKEMYTLSFEVGENLDEKVNIYYALKLPEEIPYWDIRSSETIDKEIKG